MEVLGNIIIAIVSLPSVLFITGVMFLLCLVFGGGFKRAFRAATLFGVGITAINLLMGNCTTTLSDIATALSARFNLTLNIIDYGYAVPSFAFFGAQAIVSLLLIFVIDIVFILLGWTKTMWVDIHNSWHGLFFGSIAYFLTGSFWYALAVNMIVFLIMIKLADYTAETYQEENGTPNVTFIAPITTMAGVFAKGCMAVISKIPGLKDLKASPEDIQDKFGIFGEQSVMGMIIGTVLGFLAGYSVVDSLMAGITMATTLAMFPKCAAFVCEGIVQITSPIIGFMRKKFDGKKNLYVAVDGAVLLGNPAVMATYVLIIPVIIVLYMFLPGIGFIPIASLAALPYIIGGIAPYCKSNVVHTFIVSVLFLVIAGYCATYAADIYTTSLAAIGNIDGSFLVTCLDEGGNILGVILKVVTNLFVK